MSPKIQKICVKLLHFDSTSLSVFRTMPCVFVILCWTISQQNLNTATVYHFLLIECGPHHCQFYSLNFQSLTYK